MEGLLIESLQLLVVLLFSVHLNLQGIDLEQLCALLHVVHSIHREAGLMQLLDYPCQTSVVPTVKAQLTKLHRQKGVGGPINKTPNIAYVGLKYERYSFGSLVPEAIQQHLVKYIGEYPSFSRSEELALTFVLVLNHRRSFLAS